MEMKVGFWGSWLLLGVGCLYDLKYNKIPLLLIISGGILGGIVVVTEGVGAKQLLYALMPGALLLFVALTTREKVGYGDGMLLLVLGLLEGGNACFGDLLIGLFGVSVFGLVIIVFKKSGKDMEVPFVPFLLTGHIMQSLLGS